VLGVRARDADGHLVGERTLRDLLRDERGFTVIELLIVTVILAILILLAVPGYLQLRDNAYKGTAQSNVKNVLVAANLYYTSNNSSYAGMTIAGLKTYDARIPNGTYVNNSGTDAAGVTKRITLDATHFCIYATAGRWYAYQLNPSGAITTTTIASAVCS
jgi:prepilin-type N-terminal cleavage/methylation domain-containing protein